MATAATMITWKNGLASDPLTANSLRALGSPTDFLYFVPTWGSDTKVQHSPWHIEMHHHLREAGCRVPIVAPGSKSIYGGEGGSENIEQNHVDMSKAAYIAVWIDSSLKGDMRENQIVSLTHALVLTTLPEHEHVQIFIGASQNSQIPIVCRTLMGIRLIPVYNTIKSLSEAIQETIDS